MQNWQCPVCQGRSVSATGSWLICHGCGNREYLYDYRNAYDSPMPVDGQEDTELADLEDRISNLEAISAQPGRVPRQYHEQLQQVKGEVAYLHSKLVERAAKAKPAAQASYKGLTIE